MNKISIAIPTYNRLQLTLESFADVIEDERVAEIVISDDASDLDMFYTLKAAVSSMPKVKLYRNLNNQDCYINKMIAISLCSSQYICIFDSDNRLNKEYIDAIYKEDWDSKVILAPSFAKPVFDYRHFSGLIISKENINDWFDEKLFSTALNTMNFFVNKDEFLKVWDGSVDPVTADSIYFNYCWLKNGGEIKIVGGMEYEHLVHSGSHYQTQNHRTGNFYSEVESKIRQLK